jgi:hypothetical protein
MLTVVIVDARGAVVKARSRDSFTGHFGQESAEA